MSTGDIPGRRGRRVGWIICLLALAVIALLGIAGPESYATGPFVPAGDATVLASLPASTAQVREAEQLRAALAAEPEDLETALALAQRYIQLSRDQADPRYLGYARAALDRWWTEPSPPVSVLVLRATVLQHQHDFTAALADLEAALARDPDHAQALLTHAVVLQVVGDHAAARRSCDRLAAIAELVWRACLANVDAVTGRARGAYDALLAALNETPGSRGAVAVWARTILAEIAARLGLNTAEDHFRAALAHSPDDRYLLAVYADFLLDRDRFADAVELLAGRADTEALRVRMVLAQRGAGDTTAASELAEALDADFAAAARRGDRVHLREEARYWLDVAGEPRRALEAARANWQVQREPADALVLLRASVAARVPDAAAPVRAWVEQTGIEDVRLRELAGRIPEGDR